MENKYFYIGSTFGNKWYWAHIVNKEISRLHGLKTAKDAKGTTKVYVDMGTTPGDFLGNSGSQLIISQKVLDIWKPYKKFVTYDIEVVNKEIPFKYFGVLILGNGGPLDKNRSIIQYDDIDSYRKSIGGMKGLYFYEDKWDKSDIFTLGRFRGFELITERLMKLMKKAKVTNCEYTPIEEFQYGFIEDDTLSPANA